MNLSNLTPKQEQRIKKYEGVLKRMHLLLTYTNYLSLTNVSKKHSISDITPELMQLKIVERMNSVRGKYKWVGEVPTREMAILVLRTKHKNNLAEKEAKAEEEFKAVEKLKHENLQKMKKTVIVDAPKPEAEKEEAVRFSPSKPEVEKTPKKEKKTYLWGLYSTETVV